MIKFLNVIQGLSNKNAKNSDFSTVNNLYRRIVIDRNIYLYA